jgi:hypothetical protein
VLNRYLKGIQNSEFRIQNYYIISFWILHSTFCISPITYTTKLREEWKMTTATQNKIPQLNIFGTIDQEKINLFDPPYAIRNDCYPPKPPFERGAGGMWVKKEC